jgi:2-desacetyl-2-hydroxyethyl bacteriochlorophyllide A dehydrogenase
MRQVRVHGPNDVRLDDVRRSEPGPRDAVVQVSACGVCGSDLGYIRLGGLAGPTGTPMPLGHEMSGTVGWVGDDVEGLTVGDRVVVHPGDDDLGRIGNGSPEGGLAPELIVRDAARGDRLVAVPAGLPLDVAALAEPLAVGMHAVEQADAGTGDTVAVFGCGPIGLAAVACLVDRGVADVVAVEPSAARRELAVTLGAGAAFDPTTQDVWNELADRHGTAPFQFGPTPATDVFIEASGASSVITDVIDHARVRGRLSVVALHYDPVPVSFLVVLMKQLTIRGSMEYPERFADAVDLLARRDLSPMITHRFPLDRFDEAIETLGDRDCGKVMVTVGPAAGDGPGSGSPSGESGAGESGAGGSGADGSGRQS